MVPGNWRHRRLAEGVVVAKADADGGDGLADKIRIYGEENPRPNA